MKKILLTFICLTAVVFSASAHDKKDMKMAGKVKSINPDNNVFVIESVEMVPYTFVVTPMTDFEFEDAFFDDAEFSDLEEDTWVTVKYFPGEKMHTADEVEIFEEVIE